MAATACRPFGLGSHQEPPLSPIPATLLPLPRPLPTWRQLHPDDDPRIEEMMMAWYRNATVAEKLARMEDLRRNAMAVALSGLRLRHPNAGDAELRRRLADLLFGRELARRAFGPLPDDCSGSERVAAE